MTQAAPPPCPQGRLSTPTRDVGGRRVVDTDTYVPHFLAAVNNALSRGASKRYLAEFGVGIVDWRVISMLAVEPGIPAHRICDVISLDKSATSRALAGLHGGGFLTAHQDGADPRRKTYRLTPTGYALHDRILAVALSREAQLIDGVDPGDLEAFLRVMRIMQRNVADVDRDKKDWAQDD